jgi:hypothetical protein
VDEAELEADPAASERPAPLDEERLRLAAPAERPLPGRNGGFLSLIAVMRKTKARAHNGWAMIEWTRPTRTARFSELARGRVCTSCHFQARRTDYVFTKRR